MSLFQVDQSAEIRDCIKILEALPENPSHAEQEYCIARFKIASGALLVDHDKLMALAKSQILVGYTKSMVKVMKNLPAKRPRAGIVLFFRFLLLPITIPIVLVRRFIGYVY